jgi:putative membrane protein
MSFLYVKALHIIFVVTWFAGLFYIVRLFIYFAEAEQKTEPERSILQNQFLHMQKLLWYGITWPSAIITAIMGGLLLTMYPLTQWLIIKLCFVGGLYLYHFSCQYIFNLQRQGIHKYSSTQLRIWNEVATLFLVSIVFLVVLKDVLGLFWGVLGLISFAAVLMIAIQVYKKSRDKK